jgi:capsular exopolysaccharide synthesis family protein
MRVPTLAVIPDIADDGRNYGYFRRYYGQGPAGAPKKSRKSRWLEKRSSGDTAPIELLPHSRPRLAVAEAYRSLRTALMLSTADELKLVAITSAEAGEGKTSTASNLAVVMAQLGKNTLLIDADLRKPRQHKIFRVSNRLGLVSHLTGTAEPDNILGRTSIPSLFLCPSGPIPPNPSELLSSERMRQFLEVVRARFDFVIIDTPPALAVTDAILLGAMADGVVLCCRAGYLQREGARAVRDKLRIAEVRVLGAVLNRYRSMSGGYGSSRKYLYYESYGAQEDTGTVSDTATSTKADSAA